jgi:hypothetical protein
LLADRTDFYQLPIATLPVALSFGKGLFVCREEPVRTVSCLAGNEKANFTAPASQEPFMLLKSYILKNLFAPYSPLIHRPFT